MAKDLDTYVELEEEGSDDDIETPETEEEAAERLRLEDLHEEFLEEFNGIQTVLKQERQDCLDDRRFIGVTGAQWEGFRDQFKERAQLEVDKVSQAVDQIIQDFEDNRIDAEYISKDGALDKSLADTCASLRRSDGQDSSATEARGNAFREMATGGMGAWMVTTRYEDDEHDEDDEDADPHAPRRICIEPIYDADKHLFYDLGARKPNKSDATTCYLMSPLTHRQFKRMYPKEDLASVQDVIHSSEYDWFTPDVVKIATVYRVERVPDTECTFELLLESGETAAGETYFRSKLDGDKAIEKNLKALGYRKTREVKKKRKRIHKYIMSGARILEDCGYITGKEIPIVPVCANRCFIDDVERVRGHVRKLKDAQRIKNMLLSSLAELSARAQDETAVVTTEQAAGHDIEWAEHATKPAPFLTLNPVIGPDGQKQHLGPVGKVSPSIVPPATAALHQQIDMDLKEMAGNPNEGEKVVSHTSGKGIKAIQRRVDRKSSLYIHAMGMAIQWEAQIWLGMAPEVYYQKGRKLRGIGPRQEARQVELSKPVIDPATKGLTRENDLSRAKFDVAITVGPSSDSQREAAVEAGVDILGLVEDPPTKLVLSHWIMMNMRGENVEYLREWARQNLIQNGVPGLATPEEADALVEAQKNKQPGAIDQLALAQAQEALAKVEKLMADVQLTMAKVKETEANTMKTIADANLERDVARADAAKSLHDMKMAEQQPAPGNGPSGQGNPS